MDFPSPASEVHPVIDKTVKLPSGYCVAPNELMCIMMFILLVMKW